MIQRTISTVIRSPWRNGFLGKGHLAKALLEEVSFKLSDPFIVFMDDSLDLPGGEPVGGAHPHAGFETLTLVIEGNEKSWKTGTFELMTAGKGIIHTEEITAREKVRILQVWLVLPPGRRDAQPYFQKITLEDVPTIVTGSYSLHVYSGESNGVTSPLRNHTPFILVDVKLESGAMMQQVVPPPYNGLVYVLDGSVMVGGFTISAGEAGLLEKTSSEDHALLEFTALGENTRFVIYAGQPSNAPIVQHGPFVADSMEDIARLYKEFRNGEFPHVDNLPNDQKIVYYE